MNLSVVSDALNLMYEKDKELTNSDSKYLHITCSSSLQWCHETHLKVISKVAGVVILSKNLLQTKQRHGL
jgi:hypothetical protein